MTALAQFTCLAAFNLILFLPLAKEITTNTFL
jgi:hypothetical protein